MHYVYCMHAINRIPLLTRACIQIPMHAYIRNIAQTMPIHCTYIFALQYATVHHTTVQYMHCIHCIELPCNAKYYTYYNTTQHNTLRYHAKTVQYKSPKYMPVQYKITCYSTTYSNTNHTYITSHSATSHHIMPHHTLHYSTLRYIRYINICIITLSNSTLQYIIHQHNNNAMQHHTIQYIHTNTHSNNLA